MSTTKSNFFGFMLFLVEEFLDSIKEFFVMLFLNTYALLCGNYRMAKSIRVLIRKIESRSFTFFNEEYKERFETMKASKYTQREHLLKMMWLQEAKRHIMKEKRRMEDAAAEALDYLTAPEKHPFQDAFGDDQKAKEFFDYWNEHALGYVKRNGLLSLHENDHFGRTLLLDEFIRYGHNESTRVTVFLRQNMRNRHLVDVEALCNNVLDGLKDITTETIL